MALDAVMAEYPDPNNAAPDAGNLSDYFTDEEIAEAESFYNLKADPEPEPTEAELKAEEEEKAREKAEADKDNVDDSYKAQIGDEDEKAADPDAEEAAGAERTTTNIEINHDNRSRTPNKAVKDCGQYPLLLLGDVHINKTIYIPDNSSVTIYLRGYDFIGDGLGKNPLFRVGKGATLRIYGVNGRYNRLCSGGDGAIVAKSRSTVELHSLYITNNTAGGNGGGIYLDSKVKCELYNVNIINNTAGSGGGIYVDGDLTNIYLDANTKINNNTASSGGGIYVNKGKVNIYGPAVGKAEVKGNKAKTGGGLYFNASDIKGSGMNIIENEAYKGHGGGVRMQTTKTSLAGCDIKKNKAAENGGGVYINGKVGSLTDVDIEENICGKGYHGGGVYVDSMDNVGTGGKFIVTNNYADGYQQNNKGDQNYMDDLYLQNGVKTDAYIHAASYAPGSKIGIGVTDWKENQRITFEPGNFNPKLFYCNNWIAHAKHKNQEDFYVAVAGDNNLVLTKSRAYALQAAERGLDNRKSDKSASWETGRQYETKNGQSYPIYYGYASSPSHTDESKDIVNKYFYSDGYFFEDPAYYNPHLSTFGMNLAMASADSNIGSHSDYNYKFDNVKSVLKGIGCKDKDIYISPSYIVKPTDSSIGFAIGKKTIKNAAGEEYTLIPIAIRSYGYEKEWASNMTLTAGNTVNNKDEASGFKDARTKVMNGIKSYISNYGLEGQLSQGRVKFFLVGFSRGSATANLTSKALVDTYGTLSNDYSKNPNQVFGYCYAVPAGGTDDCDTALKRNRKDYYCIHNIINKVDLTPMVAPKEMGFKRYGVDHFVPGGDTAAVKQAVQTGNEWNGSPKLTIFWDNDPWYTNSSYYKVKRIDMLKQLMNVNDEVFFVDNFKETDIITGKSEGIKSFVKGWFTEASAIKREPVKNSNVTIEQWLPAFYDKVQSYFTVGEKERLTRKTYSGTVIRAGKREKLKKGEKNWYEKGATAQDTFRGLVQMLLSKTPTEKANLGAAFSGMGNKIGLDDIFLLYEKLINSNKGWDYSYARQQDYLDFLWNKLRDNRYGQKALQDALSPEEIKDMENYYPALMSIIFRIVRQDFNDKAHKSRMRLAGTFASNTEAILQGHVPEIYLAWLRAYDSYYDLSMENVAYVWKKDTGAWNSTVKIYVSNNLADPIKEYENSQIVKLTTDDPNDGIYYKVWTVDGGDKSAVTQLYNDMQGIYLKAPAPGKPTTTYHIQAWARNSWAKDRDKIELTPAPASVKTTNIQVKAEVKNEVKVTYNKHKWDGSKWTEVTPQNKTLSVTYKPNQEVSFKLTDVDPDFATNYMNDYYIKSWHLATEDNDTDRRYRKNDTGTDRLTLKGSKTSNYEGVVIELYPKIEKLEITRDALISISPNAGKKPNRMPASDSIKIKYVSDNNLYTTFDTADYPLTSWMVKKDDGTFTYMKKEKLFGYDYMAFGFDKVYKAEFCITDYRGNGWGAAVPTGFKFKDTVEVKVDEQTGPYKPYENKGALRADYEYPITSRPKIVDCTANNPSVWVWQVDETAPGVFDSRREQIAKNLPKYAGVITGAGKTVSGLEVIWKTDRDSIPDDKFKTASTNFTIKGYINSEQQKAADFDTKFDWSDWIKNTGRDKFCVDATVHVIAKDKLAPPVPDVASGNYTLYYDDLPMDNGKVKITLNHPNSSVSTCSVSYNLAIDGGAYQGYKSYDNVTGILLDLPDENATRTYSLKVMCNANGAAGKADSEEKTYDYKIFNPVIRSVYAFARDINISPDYSYSYLSENRVEILTSVKDDKAFICYEDLVSEDDRDWYEFVSWNRITLKDDKTLDTVEHLSEDDDIIEHTISDDDVYYEAVYAPVLFETEVSLEKPETGQGLTDVPESVFLRMGNEPTYEIDPSTVSINWTASEDSIDDGIAKSKTSYTACVSISAGNLKYYDKDAEGYRELEYNKFMISRGAGADEFSVLVDEVDKDNISDNSAGITGIDFDYEYDDQGLVKTVNIYVTYEKTDTSTFYAVEPPEGLSVSFNAATVNDRFESDVKPNLPAEAAVFVDDGSIQTLPISWNFALNEEVYDEDGNPIRSVDNGVAYEQFGYVVSANDLNTLDSWSLSMNGYVTIPKDMKYDPENPDIVSDNDTGDVYCYFEYPVFMAGAPETNMPEILPQSGDIEPNNESLIKDLVVEFNTFPIGPSTNSVDVYYKITGHYFDEDGYYDDESEDEEDVDPNAPLYYDENGELKIAKNAHKYIPYNADDFADNSDLQYRTISRDFVEAGNYVDGPFDYVTVTAIASQNGAYKISNMAEESYQFLDKPTAEIPSETLEKLNSLELTSGLALNTLTLPEGCSWSPETDVWAPQDGFADDYVDAWVIYNNDPTRFNDLQLSIKVLLTAGFYDITADDCQTYLVDEEKGSFPEDWDVVTRAQAEKEIFVSANKPDENAKIIGWSVTDSEGEPVGWEYDAVYDDNDNYTAVSENIFFDMPYNDVRVRPVFEQSPDIAYVEALTLDKTAIEIKKGSSETLRASVVFNAGSEDREKPAITFKSSNPKVAEVTGQGTEARITAVSSGSATIFADCGDKTAACKVYVGFTYLNLELTNCKAYDVTGGTEQPLTDTVVKGATVKLVADPVKNATEVFKEWTVNGASFDIHKNPVTFTINTDLVARPEYGTDPAFEDPGEYAYKNQKIKSLTVVDTKETKKKISKLTIDLNKQETVEARAVYNPKENAKPPIVFRSSNTDVLKVKTVSGSEGVAQGVLVGCKPGVVTLTAYCGNKTAKVTVTVGDESVGGVIVQSERIMKNSEVVDGQYVLELFSGEQELLEAYPSDVYNTTPMKLTWKSDDTKVATVRNGLVTAKSAEKGHTTVTVTAKTKPYGSNKWITLKPVKVVIRVKETEIPKKANNDKSYNISMKGSMNLDLTAAAIGKKNIISECEVSAKLTKGPAPSKLEWRSTNENIVSVTKSADDPLKAKIRATGIGTAYVVLEGSGNGSNLVNRAVMKVTVKATAPKIYFTNDTLNALSDDQKTLTLKAGSYDRLIYNIEVPGTDYPYNTTERITWSGSGGVTVTDGVVYAKSPSKNGKPGKVTLKCGRSKTVIDVYVK